MKEKQIITESIRKRWNKVMGDLEDMNVIDENNQSYYDSEFHPSSVGELVYEAEYLLSCYYEDGHDLNELKYNDNSYWHNSVNKLKRLISFLKRNIYYAKKEI